MTGTPEKARGQLNYEAYFAGTGAVSWGKAHYPGPWEAGAQAVAAPLLQEIADLRSLLAEVCDEAEFVPDTEEIAAPPTLAIARERYRQIAPVPDPSVADPSAALARYLVVTGLRRAFLGCYSAESAETAGIAMAAGRLLHRLITTEPNASAPAAENIARRWADGEGVTEGLNSLARHFGIDPDEVNAVAATERALMLIKQQDAEEAAREMARALKLAQDAVESLHAIAEAQRGQISEMLACFREYAGRAWTATVDCDVIGNWRSRAETAEPEASRM